MVKQNQRSRDENAERQLAEIQERKQKAKEAMDVELRQNQASV